jgi:hypothetical protein
MLNGEISEKMTISYGVPQGSIMGPLLFNVFINDLPKVNTTSSIVMYADDTTIVFSHNDHNLIQTVLNADLQKVKEWLDKNKLTLNTKKTKFMLFGTRRRLSKCKDVNLFLDDDKIERVQCFKYLGIWMDENMSFNSHVEKLSKKISSRIGMISRATKYLTLEYRKVLFNAMVLPYFDYCSHVWSNINVKERNVLVRLHKRGCRMILKVPKLTPTEDVLKELQWSSIEKRWVKNKACFMYKMLKGKHPDYMVKYFTESKDVHNHKTRHAQNGALTLCKIDSESGRRTLLFSGAKLWNELPPHVRNAESYSAFKQQVCKYLY